MSKHSNPIKINFQIDARWRGRMNPARLRRSARRALNAEHASGEITIVIVNHARIRKLNREYHSTDAATDILTFPFDGTPYRGDIVISYDTARRNARAAGWSVADELDLLVTHGVLHLLGYDDTTRTARVKMWKRQTEILGHEIPPLK